MIQTIEAVTDEHGQVRLPDTVQVPAGRRVFVMILDEAAAPVRYDAAASEMSLAKDWLRPEEDAAWSYLR